MKRALFIGCGNSRTRKVRTTEEPETYSDEWKISAIDINPDCGATQLCDLGLYLPGGMQIPGIEPDTFDEINAFDSLEHWGVQGDFRGWFNEMDEYYRILKPGGQFNALVPIGQDAIVDPGHTRFFSLMYFLCLTKEFYEKNEGKPVTDYRWLIQNWWTIDFLDHVDNHHIVVRMRKPA